MKFTEEKITKGKLITVIYDNDKQKSGIVTGVTENQVKFVYFDTTIDQLETGYVTSEDYESGKVKKINTLTAIRLKEKDSNAKTSKPSFELTEERIKEELGKYSADELIIIFDAHNKYTLATVAALLEDNKKFEFLYKLSVNKEVKVFDEVSELENRKDIRQNYLKDIHDQLDKMVSTEDKSYTNGSEEFAPNPEKVLEEMLKRLGGKDLPFGDLFGGGTGPFGGFGGGFGPLGDIFKEFNKGNNQNQNKNNQPPNPNDMLNNLTNMLNDLLKGNDPRNK